MNLEQAIQKTAQNLNQNDFCQKLHFFLLKPWFWIPLLLLNYLEYFFPFGILYCLVCFIGCCMTWKAPFEAKEGAYMLDYFAKSNGEISAWFENQENFFAPYLLKQIKENNFVDRVKEQQYKSFFLNKSSFALLLGWFFPIILLLNYPLFRSSEEWLYLEQKKQLSKKIEQLETSFTPNSSISQELDSLRKALEKGNLNIEEALKKLKKVYQKLNKERIFDQEEQQILSTLLEDYPEFRKLLEEKEKLENAKTKEKLQQWLQELDVSKNLQEKILEKNYDEIEKSRQFGEKEKNRLAILESLLPKEEESVKLDSLNNSDSKTENNLEILDKNRENLVSKWPVIETFPPSLHSSRFEELLSILEEKNK